MEHATDKLDSKFTFVRDNENLEQYCKSLFFSLVHGIQKSNGIPTERNGAFYRSFSFFDLKLHRLQEKLANLIDELFLLVPSTENLSLSCQTFFDEQFNVVVDFLDHLLEQVDTTIDLNIKGIKNNPLTCSGNQQSFTMKTHLKKPISLNTKNIPKPQIFFPEKIDNSNSPFVPKLKRKLNAASEDFTPIFDEETNSYAHPYEFELTTFTVSQKQMQEVVPQKFQDLKGSPIFYVDTLTTLQELCTYLQSVSEIAVDLEEKSFYPFKELIL
ncbi:exosome complex component 10-like [Zophobas morio]|uniref:exosome complex component 10-like n=1 Tax=Zophobas morio TaxID=2755281 RepID=UPI0030832389